MEWGSRERGREGESGVEWGRQGEREREWGEGWSGVMYKYLL